MQPSTIRSVLFAFAIGAAAPILAGVLVAIGISLGYSAVFAGETGDEASRLEAGRLMAARIQGAAPVLTTTFIFLGGLFVGRRIHDAPHRSAIAVAAGGGVVGQSFAVGFGTPVDWMLLPYIGADVLAAGLGVLLGFDRSRAAAALDAATLSLRRVHSEADIASALHDACAPLGVVRVSIGRVEDGRKIICSARAPVDHASSEPVDLFRDETLREQLDRGEPLVIAGRTPTLWVPLLRDDEIFGALKFEAARARDLSLRRQPLWNALGAQVALSLANIDLLEQVRVAASHKERQRLTADIHDTLAQNLISAVVHLEAAQRKTQDGRLDAHHVGEALTAAREGLGQARSLVWSSRDGAARQPFGEVLSKVVSDFETRTGIETSLAIVGELIALGSDGERLLIRAAREGLNNIRKHAEASRVRLTLTYMEDTVALDLADDGTGFDTNATPNPSAGLGFGLTTLREQAEGLGGQMSLESEPTSGTILTVQLPSPARRVS